MLGVRADPWKVGHVDRLHNHTSKSFKNAVHVLEPENGHGICSHWSADITASNLVQALFTSSATGLAVEVHLPF